MQNAAEHNMSKQPLSGNFAVINLVKSIGYPREEKENTYCLFEDQPILQNPGRLNELSDLGIVSGSVDLICSLLQPAQDFLKFCVCNGIIACRSVLGEVLKKQRILANSLNRLSKNELAGAHTSIPNPNTHLNQQVGKSQSFSVARFMVVDRICGRSQRFDASFISRPGGNQSRR